MKIEIDKFDLDEIEKFIEFSKTYYDNPETTEKKFVTNKFMDSKLQSSYHLKLKKNNKILGRVVLNTRNINLLNKKVKATQVTDLLINQDNKDPMMFVKLVKSYNYLKNDLVIHTSNENSENIYKKFFKFQIIFSMKSYGFPLKPFSILSNITKKNFSFLKFIDFIYLIFLRFLFRLIKITSQINLQYCELDELKGENVKKFNDLNKLSMERSEDFLEWRFEKNPNEYIFRKILRGQNTIGFAVFRNVSYNGLNTTLLIDLYLLSKINLLEKIKIREQFLSECIKFESDIFFSIINKNNTILSEVFGFPIISINDNLLKHATPIFCSSINDEIKLDELSKIHFTLADLDYF